MGVAFVANKTLFTKTDNGSDLPTFGLFNSQKWKSMITYAVSVNVTSSCQTNTMSYVTHIWYMLYIEVICIYGMYIYVQMHKYM